MLIKKLFIENLRNHGQTMVEFNDNLNIIYGQNGSGKTSILEAISILSFSKTFLPTSDSGLINYTKEGYNLNAQCKNENDLTYKISIAFEKGSKKKINSSYGENLTPKDIIGEIPLVVLSPDLKVITFGSPQDRREFIDRLLSQISKSYLLDLIDYRRILKQRNQLLSLSRKERYFDYKQIEPWTDLLIKRAADIVIKRYNFLNEFTSYFDEYYKIISENRELVKLQYVPNNIINVTNIIDLDKTKLIEDFKLVAEKMKLEESYRGSTLWGPHRDELKIFVNQGIAKEAASQGQHKTLLISLKMAEFIYLKNKVKETPIILLDDIFSELDLIRSNKVLKLIEEYKVQTFITLTEKEKFDNENLINENVKYIKLENGKILE